MERKFIYTDHQASEPLLKMNRSKKQYSARLSRWLDRLIHFNISKQHIAASNLNVIDYLSRNSVGRTTLEANYGKECRSNILTEQAELNIKYHYSPTNPNATKLKLNQKTADPKNK